MSCWRLQNHKSKCFQNHTWTHWNKQIKRPVSFVRPCLSDGVRAFPEGSGRLHPAERAGLEREGPPPAALYCCLTFPTVPVWTHHPPGEVPTHWPDWLSYSCHYQCWGISKKANKRYYFTACVWNQTAVVCGECGFSKCHGKKYEKYLVWIITENNSTTFHNINEMTNYTVSNIHGNHIYSSHSVG